MLLDVAFGGVAEGELTLAHRLVSSAPDHSLPLFDRCYFSAAFFLEWQQAGTCIHWLKPVKNKLRYQVIERYSDHDMLIGIPISPQARKAPPHFLVVWRARMVSYVSGGGQRKNHRISHLHDGPGSVAGRGFITYLLETLGD
ncbi:hypothetical protein FS594_14420 [Rahnella aquatilis]|nr:hypothetical protein FS594_14420 [Rahnella aquatilis]